MNDTPNASVIECRAGNLKQTDHAEKSKELGLRKILVLQPKNLLRRVT